MASVKEEIEEVQSSCSEKPEMRAVCPTCDGCGYIYSRNFIWEMDKVEPVEPVKTEAATAATSSAAAEEKQGTWQAILAGVIKRRKQAAEKAAAEMPEGKSAETEQSEPPTKSRKIYSSGAVSTPAEAVARYPYSTDQDDNYRKLRDASHSLQYWLRRAEGQQAAVVVSGPPARCLQISAKMAMQYLRNKRHHKILLSYTTDKEFLLDMVANNWHKKPMPRPRWEYVEAADSNEEDLLIWYE